MNYYLAVDIGASSGRHILGSCKDGKLQLEEVYRFPNEIKEKNGRLCWDLKQLYEEIIKGIQKCGELGKTPVSMGIDTWAVDFVLLDKNDRVLGDTVSYRDHRTDTIDQQVEACISREELYHRTGIQKQNFNSIYQLMAIKKEHPEELEEAQTMLLIPDYFTYLLTGNKLCEYTNATTTQLVSPDTKTWDEELINRLGYPRRIFNDISMPGTFAGNFTEEVKKKVGFDVDVLLTATHDTASAVVAVPALKEDFLYISSGTWSLMGIEQRNANCGKASMDANLTNEGGYGYRFRFLKNIMGLWMIQSVKKELDNEYSFAQMCQMAEEARNFPSTVDVNDRRFLSPESMIQAIRQYCEESRQIVPRTAGELAQVIYASLAASYAKTVKEIEVITGRTYKALHIVGGGCNARYLNHLTAEATGLTVYAGPDEATATGNLVVQMLKAGVFQSLEEARRCIHESFEIRICEAKRK